MRHIKFVFRNSLLSILGQQYIIQYVKQCTLYEQNESALFASKITATNNM